MMALHARSERVRRSRLQPAERASAGGEFVRLDAEALEHADVEIGNRRRFVRVEREMLAVFEASASKQEGEVLRRVVRRIAQVAAEKDHRVVEQRAVLLAGLLELCQEFAVRLHQFQFHLAELRDFSRILAVVGKIVVTLRDARDRRHLARAEQEQRDESRGAVSYTHLTLPTSDLV